MTGWVAFTVMVWSTLQAARRLEAHLFPSDTAIDRSIRVAVAAVALVVACMLLLGATSRLTVIGVVALQAAVLLAAWRLRSTGVSPMGPGTRDAPGVALSDLPVLPVAIVGGLLSFALAFAMTHAPLTLYDSLSYHLFFAARWVQDHAITIIPTPFSDEAQAYTPGNGELFFAWLMLPIHSDALARMGQFPFGLLAAVTLFALTRRLGAPASHAIYPAAFFLLSRPIVEQMMGADVDLLCAALFLTTLYLIVAAIELDRPADWALAGVSFGLFLGSKYLALVYTPVILLLVFAHGIRRRLLWALPTAAAFALPWYARNWLVAGSPIYPASLTVAGVTLARGAYDRAAMLNTVFHTTDLRLFPVMVAHAFGPPLALLWLPFAALGWIAMARRGWWPHGVLALVPVLMAPLYWYVLPVNIDSRFLMPAIAPALLPLAFVFPQRRKWNAVVHAIYMVGMIWLVVGARVTIGVPVALPWYMRDWLVLNGLVTSEYLLWFGAVVATLTMTWQLARRAPRLALPIMTVVLLAVGAGLSVASERACTGACNYLDTTSPFILHDYVEAWRWLDDNLRDATIAYTGINLPYPLTGDRLTNRVVYVAIDGRSRWRFHDYDRAYRSGRFEPRPPLLATSSGELQPVAARLGPRDDAVRPRYERMQGNRDAWVFALETMKVRYVFIAAMSMYEVDYVWHNDRGFPIEDEWAKVGPAQFELVFKNPRVHIYELRQATPHP